VNFYSTKQTQAELAICGQRRNVFRQVNFMRWNKRFFRLNFSSGGIEYQAQEGVGQPIGEFFFSKDSAVERQGA
jgi:hypothetical protein